MNRRQNEALSFLISIYYKEYGPFNLEELAKLAARRDFGWDMYAYRHPKDNVWRPVRDIPELREILLKNFPIQAGDQGPAGGHVFKDKNSKLIEVSPADAGYCAWENAENVCKNFSFNGYKDWRLPTKDELLESSGFISSQIRQKENTVQTNELILHWSNERKKDSATAVITCVVEDKYVQNPTNGTSGGHYVNKDGIKIGIEKQLPVTEWHPVRPVRNLN